MYKDPDKHREAVKLATRRYRAKKADSVLSSQKDGLDNARGLAVVDKIGDTQPVIPLNVIPKLEPEDKGQELHLCIKSKPKRGKDIKCFEDLPRDVQETIDIMSVVEGKIDQTMKANRTAIAINYQHLFPGRY